MSRRRRIVLGIGVAVCAAILALLATGYWVSSRYITSEPADASAAARAFDEARAGFADQLPLIEYRGFQPPVVRRNLQAPRRELRALHVLVFNPDEETLERVVVPSQFLRIVTLGGRRRLMSAGMLGSANEPVTLEDLERHGPGLVLDATGAQIGPLVAATATLGSNALSARVLIWSE